MRRVWAFREPYPEILGAVRQIVAAYNRCCGELGRGASRMIRAYREIIS
jgi:hypothetical protein